MRLLIILLAFSATSCATILQGPKQNVVIQSEYGSTIWVNGSKVGQDRVTVPMARNKDQIIMVEKQGCDTKTSVISSTVSPGFLFLDVVFGIYPLIFDAVTGNWRNFGQDYTVILNCHK